MGTSEERARREARLLDMAYNNPETQRDMEVARATVRPRSECPSCNPGQHPAVQPKIGDRIELVFMPNDPDPIPSGTQGTVTNVVEFSTPALGHGQIWVDWDNNRTLCLLIGVDEWKRIE